MQWYTARYENPEKNPLGQKTPGGGLPYETDGDARRKFWI